MFDIVLKEKEAEYGLTRSEALDMFDMLNENEAFPLEILAKEHECLAMGWITPKAADKIYFDYEASGLNTFVANILDDMENESDDCQYSFKGLSIWLSR